MVASPDPAAAASWETELAEARRAQTELAARLRETQANLDLALQQHGARLAEATQASRTARADLAAMEARATAAETAAGQAQRAREQAVAQIAGLRRTLIALERELAMRRGSDAAPAATAAAALTEEAVAPDQSETPAHHTTGELERQLTELQAENDRLRRQLAQQDAPTATAPTDAGAAEAGDLRRQLDAAQQEIASLKSALAAARATPIPVVTASSESTPGTADARLQLEAELQERRAQVQRLEQENRRLAGEVERLTLARQSELESLQMEVTQLQAQLEGARLREQDLRQTVIASAVAAQQGRVASNVTVQRPVDAAPAALTPPPAVSARVGSSAERVLPDFAGVNAPVTPSAQSSSGFRIKTIPPLPPGAGRPGRHSPTRPSEIAFRLPTPLPAALPLAQPRSHVVAAGDTLTGISARYYGTAYRWEEIFEANREQLAQPNLLRIGQRLRLP